MNVEVTKKEHQRNDAALAVAKFKRNNNNKMLTMCNSRENFALQHLLFGECYYIKKKAWEKTMQ